MINYKLNKQQKIDRIQMIEYLCNNECLTESPDNDRFSLNGINIWITTSNDITLFIRNKIYISNISFKDIYVYGINFYIEKLMNRLFDTKL